MSNKRPPARRYEQMIVRYYNIIADANADTLADIPDRARRVLDCLEYIEIVRPLIAIDLQNNVDSQVICNRYGVKRSTVRGVGRKHGVYARRRCNRTNAPG